MLPLIGFLGTAIQAGVEASDSDEGRRHATMQGILARRYSERMSSTAYQRSMADMRQAGLNPILAYKTGGASTPSSGIPSAGNANFAGLASSAISAARLGQELKNLKQDAKTSHAVEMKGYSARHLDVANRLYREEELRQLKLGREAKEQEEALDKSKGGKFLRGVNRVFRTVNPFKR